MKTYGNWNQHQPKYNVLAFIKRYERDKNEATRKLTQQNINIPNPKHQINFNNINLYLDILRCIINNIMQAISQQPQPQHQDHYLILKAQAKIHQRINLTLVTIHQLDSTYYGEINKSYQKQGFGILQTLNFQTYFGYWKNNKVEGIGIIFYPTGQIIYGQFSRNTLNGMGIADDGRFLRLGVFQGLDMTGIGYEYMYQTSKWRMMKYVKGTPVQRIRQQVLPISEGIPDMISAQHSLFQCLSSYLKQSFFNNEEPKLKKAKTQIDDKYKYLNDVVVSQRSDLIAVGFRDQGGMHGLGVIFNTKEKIMLNSGFFIGNQLNGYCLQNIGGASRIIGPFFQGLKHGHFIKYSSSPKIDTIQFQQNQQIGPSPFLEEQISKRQKSYNFEQKDFLSAKNTVEFANLFNIFTPPQVRSLRSKSRKAITSENKEEEEQKIRLTQKTPISSKKPSKNQQKNPQLPISSLAQKIQRSCIDIIRQKLRGYQMVKNQKSARLSSEQKRKRILNSNFNMFNQSQQSIAVEQNPFDSVALRSSKNKKQ